MCQRKWRLGYLNMAKARSQLWGRGYGVTLVNVARLPVSEGLERAMLDGVARGYGGPLPEQRLDAKCYLIRAESQTVGVLGIAKGPGRSVATIVGVAIDPAWRGKALGTRAVRVVARRLRREGVRNLYGRAPRSNGRGLYFWLRAGFSIALSLDTNDDATWFQLALR